MILIKNNQTFSSVEFRRYKTFNTSKVITTFKVYWSLGYVNDSLTELIQEYFRHCLKLRTIQEHLHTHRGNFWTPVTRVRVVRLFWRSFWWHKPEWKLLWWQNFFLTLFFPRLFLSATWPVSNYTIILTSTVVATKCYSILFTDMKRRILLP